MIIIILLFAWMFFVASIKFMDNPLSIAFVIACLLCILFAAFIHLLKWAYGAKHIISEQKGNEKNEKETTANVNIQYGGKNRADY